MNKLFFLFILILNGCATNTEYYPVMDKKSFLQEQDNSSFRNMTLVKGRSFHKEVCVGQVLFFNNAFKETESVLANQVRYVCPDSNYLLEAEVEKTWWTLLFYSRSCAEIKAYCPKK